MLSIGVKRILQGYSMSQTIWTILTREAYRQYHSTDTAVTKVYNDLLLAADEGGVSAMCLLDLSAAFNTVEHDLLMLRLERQFGLRGVVPRCRSPVVLPVWVRGK